jgi:hypothetical protein
VATLHNARDRLQNSEDVGVASRHRLVVFRNYEG